MSTTRTNPARAAMLTLGVGLAAVSLAALGGCRGDRSDKPPRQFFPDMDDQPKWEPQGASGFYADGRQMRKPVQGTVAFGRTMAVSSGDWAEPFNRQRTDLLRESDALYQGTAADGSYLAVIPAEVNVRLLETGREKFNIYCAACHGYDGAGKGVVGSQWSYPLPSFLDAKYRAGATEEVTGADGKTATQTARTGLDGYLFHTARYGVIGPDGAQKMPGYAHALTERDAWAVVAYIRVLQAAHDGVPIDQVPERERQTLEQMRSRAAATPDAPKGGNS